MVTINEFKRVRSLAVLGVASAFLLSCGVEDGTALETEQASYALTGTIPVYGSNAPDFWVLSDGTNLKAYDSSSVLSRRTGLGKSFSSQSTYEKLKKDAKVYWVVADLDTGTIFGQSSNSKENVYGASVSKALVVGALLAKKNGQLDTSTWQKVFKLLVNSDNSVWSTLENLAGGKDAVHDWTQSMGYTKTLGYRSGNKINAYELALFLHDIHHQRFPGAEGLLKVMSACNTASAKGRKYLPKTLYMGGKTGTYNSASHQMGFLEVGTKRYAVVVLTEKGSSENVAIMFAGLYKEYLSNTPSPPPTQPPAPPPAEPSEGQFIGGSCSEHRGCESGMCLTSYADGYAFPSGMCTQSCTKLCPDKDGEPETFCITFNAATGYYNGQDGYCFSRCDTKRYPGNGCRQGFSCVKAQRHNQTSTQRNVCVPDPGAGSPYQWSPPDEEGDLPNPERMETLAGCAYHGEGIPTGSRSHGAALLLLLLIAAVTYRKTIPRR